MSQRRKSLKLKNAGFTLLELMVATLLFVVITGVVFAVLVATQKRYKSEKEYMGAFQQANIAIDQIARDIHGAGFPSKLIYNTSVQVPGNANKWAVPVASAAEIAAITSSNPGTFPGGAAVPIFTFPLYQGAAQVAPNIHNINISLIVQAPSRDQQTQRLRIATFTAQASTVNPYQ